MKTSFPKNKIKVLLLENIHANAKDAFEKEGYQVECVKGSLSGDALIEKIKDVHILGVRSKSAVTAEVLKHANKLWAIGSYCIGTNNICLDTCLTNGMVSFNAPFSNTRSVVELAVACMINLSRKLTDINQICHSGAWHKSADNCFEVRGKTLGIIGYGNIGAQLSVVAEALGMNVIFYDSDEKLVMGNADKCETLNELLETADFVSLHVDGRADNKNLIDKTAIAKMKKGAYLINLSRGHVVDIKAAKAALENGHLNGGAFDVYPEEPATNNDPFTTPLQGLKNVILTPHIGGSTLEAQENIAHFVSTQIIKYMNTGSSMMSCNFPELKLPMQSNANRMIHIHQNTPGVLAFINETFAKYNINVMGQYLKTNDSIGYVITDINQEYDPAMIEALKGHEATVRFRVLY